MFGEYLSSTISSMQSTIERNRSGKQTGNVNFTSTVYEENDLNSKFWDAEFSLVRAKGGDVICQFGREGECVNEIYPHFNMTVVRIIKKLPGLQGLRWKRVFHFQLTIIQADDNEFGMFLVRSDKPSCTILRINIIYARTVLEFFSCLNIYQYNGRNSLCL